MRLIYDFDTHWRLYAPDYGIRYWYEEYSGWRYLFISFWRFRWTITAPWRPAAMKAAMREENHES